MRFLLFYFTWKEDCGFLYFGDFSSLVPRIEAVAHFVHHIGSIRAAKAEKNWGEHIFSSKPANVIWNQSIKRLYNTRAK